MEGVKRSGLMVGRRKVKTGGRSQIGPGLIWDVAIGQVPLIPRPSIVAHVTSHRSTAKEKAEVESQF